jgi:hypothetical protein
MPAILLAWCIGVNGFLFGLSGMAFLRSGRVPDVAAAARNTAGSFNVTELGALMSAVRVEAMQRAYRVQMPICIAQLLLGGLLVIASGMVMSGRRGARGLALQALAANVGLAIVKYALTRDVRGAVIDAVMRVVDTLPPDLPERASHATREALWWSGRFLSACEVGMLALVMVALFRQRTKAYFDAVARATDSAGEP